MTRNFTAVILRLHSKEHLKLPGKLFDRILSTCFSRKTSHDILYGNCQRYGIMVHTIRSCKVNSRINYTRLNIRSLQILSGIADLIIIVVTR